MIGKRLRKLRENKGITQKELGKAIAIGNVTLSQYESNTRTPDIDTLMKIANYFGVTTDYLLGKSDETSHGATARNPRRIPVLGSVRAGIPVNEDQDIIDWEEISDKMARTGDYFGLVVRGDSMAPALYEGDVLIVRKQPNVENGETAIVCVNGDEHTVKRVRLNPDGSMILMANNALYAPIIYTAQEVQELPVTILGKVVEFRRKL